MFFLNDVRKGTRGGFNSLLSVRPWLCKALTFCRGSMRDTWRTTPAGSSKHRLLRSRYNHRTVCRKNMFLLKVKINVYSPVIPQQRTVDSLSSYLRKTEENLGLAFTVDPSLLSQGSSFFFRILLISIRAAVFLLIDWLIDWQSTYWASLTIHIGLCHKFSSFMRWFFDFGCCNSKYYNSFEIIVILEILCSSSAVSL